MSVLADAAAMSSAAGLLQAAGAWQAAKRFNQHAPSPLIDRPPVTVLKPLKGKEPLLEAALTSFCNQAYPRYQIVFGVQSKDDLAIPIVEKLKERFPERDLTLIIDETAHGGNPKIGNLINMWPSAQHDIIVMADSDVHVMPDFLERAVAALIEPDCGLATALYAGMSGGRGRVGAFGAAQINHIFLPGVMVGRILGRQDCLGAAVAFRREMLDRVGGLSALLPHLADDFVLGALVRSKGMRISLVSSLVTTTVPEASYGDLFMHELRWARTIRALAPLTYATMAFQFPVVWGLTTVLIAGFAWWSWAFLALVWLLRGMLLQAITRELRLEPFSSWLVPLREGFSLAVLVAAYFSNRVVWRGNSMSAVACRLPLKPRVFAFKPPRRSLGEVANLTRGVDQP